MEFLQLYKSDGGKMGGSIGSWSRVGVGGIYALDQISKHLSEETSARLVGKDGKTMSEAEKSKKLGLLAYACQQDSLRSLLRINLKVAMAELEMRAGGEETAKELLSEGMQALLLVCWGAAPEQQGGRAAQREYVDVNVHLSPVSAELWDPEELSVELLPPARGKLVERGGGGGKGKGGQGGGASIGERGSFAESFGVGKDGAVSPTMRSSLAVRKGSELWIARSSVSDPTLALFEELARVHCGLRVQDAPPSSSSLDQWEEVFLVGSTSLVASVASVQERGGRAWERSAESEGMVGPKLSELVNAAVASGLQAI